LQMFAFALRPAGVLILGKSETTAPLPEYFERFDARLKIFSRRANPMPIPSNQIKAATTTAPGAALPRPEYSRLDFGLSTTHQPSQLARGRNESAERVILDLPIGVV